MGKGIDVWFDTWEIRAGDSLRRKMEEGLGACTHFIVVLTPTSVGKPWVNEEIDVAFVRKVAGRSKFMALRCGVDVSSLSPFVGAQLCREFRVGVEEDFAKLVADIEGVSLKPALGARASYVNTVSAGVAGWSTAAAAVAEYLVTNSEFGVFGDPQSNVEEVATAVGIPLDDASDAVSDLEDAGHVEVIRSLGDRQALILPKSSLFVEFDQHFAGIDSKGDAVAIVAWVMNSGAQGANADQIEKQFPDWSIRRINSALNYLDESKVVLTSKGMHPQWSVTFFALNDKSRRFVRENT